MGEMGIILRCLQFQYCHLSCFLISLHGYFVIEMLRMRLFLYPSNLSIVFYQTTAFVEKQVMPLSVEENANRWSRKRQSFLVESSIVSRWYLARHSLLFRSFFACSSFGPRSVFDRLTTKQRETNERRTRT